MSEIWNRLRTAWDNLSLRERLLLSIGGGLLGVLLIVLLVVNPLIRASDRAELRAETAEQELGAMVRLQREYQEIRGGLDSVEERIQANTDRTSLLTLLEALAGKSDVKIDSMEERQSPPSERYRETRVEVTLKSVTLTQIVKYLHSIESTGRLLSVKSLRMRTRVDDPALMDINFSVSTFEPV